MHLPLFHIAFCADCLTFDAGIGHACQFVGEEAATVVIHHPLAYPCATPEDARQSLAALRERRDKGLVTADEYLDTRRRLVQAALKTQNGPTECRQVSRMTPHSDGYITGASATATRPPSPAPTRPPVASQLCPCRWQPRSALCFGARLLGAVQLFARPAS
jgi:hypothetical protein